MSAGDPVLQALLIADRVYQDRETGKHIIVGTFTQLRSREFPCLFPGPLHAFCVLTNVSTSIAISMRLVTSDDEIVMNSSAVSITCRDPLQTLELPVPIPSLNLPRAGWYRLELLIDDSPIGFLGLQVIQV